ncbi:hypothetical protein [Nocardia sp. NPDC057227]|uniref:hypothetical protein n=1 Tax=Nocardia sp. NPDC057227 TaxID=3346056 RepID=UPI0036348843
MNIDIDCPLCHRADVTQSVPALVAGGTSTSTATGTYTGAGISPAGLVPVLGTATMNRVHVSALAESLAPAPPLQPTDRLTVVGLLLLVFGLIPLIPATLALTDDGGQSIADRIALFIAILVMLTITLFPAVLTFNTTRTRRRRNLTISQGRPAALAVWRTAVYCHRCGIGYWPSAPAPNIPAQQGFSPHELRWLVWSAGGYANA